MVALSRPHLEATQLCLFYMSQVPLELPPSTRAQNECLGASESMGRPFERMLRFPAAFHLNLDGWILTGFHSHVLWVLLFLALVLWAREPSVGMEHHSSRGTSLVEISLLILDCHT